MFFRGMFYICRGTGRLGFFRERYTCCLHRTGGLGFFYSYVWKGQENYLLQRKEYGKDSVLQRKLHRRTRRPPPITENYVDSRTGMKGTFV